MANTLRFKRGLVAGIPTGVAGEPLFTTDTFDLYIGNGTTNTRFQKYIASGTTLQYLRGDGTLATFPLLTGFVPYTGATANVDLGVYTILAQNATIASSGSGDTATITHSSGSGIGLNITKGGNGEGLYINKTSGSGNAATIIGTLNATTLVKSGGLSTEYLKADGSVSTLTNPVTGTGTTNYLPKFTGASTLGDSTIQEVSSNIGIGVSPTSRLHVSATVWNSSEPFVSFINLDNNAVDGKGLYVQAGALNNTTYVANFADYNGASLLYLNGRGNLGLGVVPSAWASTDKAIQLSTTASIVGTTGSSLKLGNNFYFNGNNVYLTSAGATLYQQTGSEHRWYYAPSGTAGNNISFTQGMTLTANGRLLLGTTSEGTQRLQVNGTGYFADSLGIGSTSLTNISLRISKTITGINTGNGVWLDGQVQSDVTSSYRGFRSTLNIVNSTFTLSNVYHVLLEEGTIGASSTVTNQYGLFIGNLTKGGSNFGIYNDVSSGTNKWGYYGAGTAPSYYNGSVGIGTTGLTGYSLAVGKNITGSTNAQAVRSVGVIQSDVTSKAYYYTAQSFTANANFALPDLYLYAAFGGTLSNITAGGSITNQYGYFADSSLIGATNNFGFYGNIASGTGRWNLYMNGTAANYLNGQLVFNAVGLTDFTLSATTHPIIIGGERSATLSPMIKFTKYDYGSADISLNYNNTFYTGGKTLEFKTETIKLLELAVNNTSTTGLVRIPNGNLLIGTSAVDTGEKLQVNGTMKVTGASTFGGNMGIGVTTPLSLLHINGADPILLVKDTETGAASANARLRLAESGGAGAVGEYWDIHHTGLDLAFTRSDYGEVARFSGSGTGAATFLTNLVINGTSIEQNNASGLTLNASNASGAILFRTAGAERLSISNTGAATFSSTLTTGGNILLGATASTIGAMNLILTGTSPVASRLTFGTDGTGYSFAIGKNQAGTVTDLFSILDSGAANFTTSIQAGTAIAIGTTPDTNKPFKILKNINATVGINFENTSTSSLAFSAIQMGTDVTGGTAFTNLVYGSSGITEAGAYKPSGTSLVNTGAGGLNFLAVSQPIRFFTSSGNGTLRASITNDGDFTQFNGTNPAASTTDAFRMYSADVVAGNAAPHFRTENGAVIKLYQETTGVGNAIFSAGGGTGVLDDSTFDGYTLRQIVKALRNQGILA